MIYLGPETPEEAGAELGYASREQQRRHLAELEELVARKHAFDVDAIVWGEWRPCRMFGRSSWECHGELESEGDVLGVDVVTSPDHDLFWTAEWRSNGRSPAAWKLEELRLAALEHSYSAPSEGHPRAGAEAQERDGHAPPARRLVIAVGRSWTSEAIEPPPVEPDPPQDFCAALSQHVNAAAARDLAGDTPPATPDAATGVHPARVTPRAAAPIPPQPRTLLMHHAIDLSLVPEVLRPRVEELQELRALIEDPPPGIDVAANVAEYVANATADVALAVAVFLAQALDPAIDGVISEGRRLSARAKVLKARRVWLRQVLLDMLQRLGVRRLDGPTVGVSLRAGAWRVEQDPGVDVELLDPRFVRRPPPEPNLAAIADALERGETVPGFRRVQGSEGVMLR